MSEIAKKTNHSSKLDHFFDNLTSNGWIINKPRKSPDKKAFLIRVLPPMTKLDVECLIFGVDAEYYYIIGMGPDYNTQIPVRVLKDAENIDEVIEAVIKRTEDGQHEEVSAEISQFLERISED